MTVSVHADAPVEDDRVCGEVRDALLELAHGQPCQIDHLDQIALAKTQAGSLADLVRMASRAGLDS